MSKCKRLCSIILAITVLLTALGLQGFNVFAEKKRGIINDKSVGLRQEANTTSARLEVLNKDETVTILETVTGTEAEKGHGTTWYKIKRENGQEGFVYGFYVTVIPELSDENFENFPESYRESLKLLKAIYPKCTFVIDELDISFSEAVNIQFTTAQRKQVEARNGLSWRSMHKNAYNWSNNTYVNNNGGWVSASKSIISYYLDPRNFLSYDTAFMFVQQSFNKDVETAEVVKAAVAGTFLADGYDGNPDAYINDILKAAEKHNVSPLVLVATIITEQGTKGTSSLISGEYVYQKDQDGKIVECKDYYGYYNYFNIGASGTDSVAVVQSGLQTAKENGWDTREKSIVGGAETYADGYISEGQDTFYYKNFNFVYQYPKKIYHQYAQSIFDSYNNGIRLKKGYSAIDNENITLTFRIPVFKNMPKTPVKKPAENSKENNFYLTEMKVDGLSPAFDMFNQSYSLKVSKDTTISVKVPEGASITSQENYELSSGTNKCVIKVKAQTGYTNSYTISVNASKECVLTVKVDDTTESNPSTPDASTPEPPTSEPPTSEPPTSEPPTSEPTTPEPPSSDTSTPEAPTIKKGDPNGDGKVNGVDLAAIRLHILGLRTFKATEVSVADVNGDGKVNGVDLAAVRLHILGLRIIE